MSHIVALLFALADIARSRGKKIEEQIEEQICDELGGKPSVAMLRHSDTSTFDAASKARYIGFLCNKITASPPNEGVCPAGGRHGDGDCSASCRFVGDRPQLL